MWFLVLNVGLMILVIVYVLFLFYFWVFDVVDCIIWDDIVFVSLSFCNFLFYDVDVDGGLWM